MESSPAPAFDPRSQALFGGAAAGASDLIDRLKRSAPPRPRYEGAREIAHGGMGAVLRVTDRAFARELAMKVVRDAPLSRFLDEAVITGQLDHPGIVPVHELGVGADGQLYFTMRLIEGHTFADVIDWVARRERGFTLVRALEVLLRVCDAVAYAHRRGVVHRDLKPQNVMVGGFGETYVVDWGLARVVHAAAGPAGGADATRPVARPSGAAAQDLELRTLHGAVLGTPAYMPPEQALGRIDEIGAPSDVYAVGAMLYHLLAGHAPYADVVAADADAEEIVEAARAGAPTDVARREGRAPAELVSICQKAMRRDPRERYADMGEMGADLRAFVEGRVVRAHRTGALAELRKWVARNRRATAAAALALVVALAGFGAIESILRSKNRELTKANGEAQARFDDVTRLEALQRMRDLERRADTLWPPTEAQVEAMTRWLGEAKEIAAGRARHAATLAGLASRNLAASGEAPRFADPFDAWWHESLTELLRELDRLAADEPLRVGTIAEMERRAARASSLRRRTITEFGDEWKEAIDAIATEPLYGGLEIAAQPGLVPLGPDPGSRLWEFWLVDSGERPKRDRASGSIDLDDESGLVFVLLPGGRYLFGAQSASALQPQFDKLALPDDDPTTVELAPFFLSKYEMTQAQWLRVTGANPSLHRPGAPHCTQPHSLLHPVESITWREAASTTRRLGIELPTAVQWEYAARAGTTAAYIGGDAPAALEGAGNVADLSYTRLYAVDPATIVHWDDGFACSAPVGRFPPNAFGLEDMVGNVAETCRDAYVGRRSLAEFDAGDGEQRPRSPSSLPPERITRGGSYGSTIMSNRAAFETSRPETTRSGYVGLRPMRRLER